MSGLLIAGKVPHIPRIGITLETLHTLQIPISVVAEGLTERNKHAEAVEKLYLDDFIAKKDWDFVSSHGSRYGGRIEIDNVVAYTGAKKFWQDFVVKRLGDLFPSRDYRRSVKIPESITPPVLQDIIDSVYEKSKEYLKPEREKIVSQLQSYDGFIENIPKEVAQVTEKMLYQLANVL
jgi:hypothetical protein